MNDINDECVEYTLCCLVSTRWSSSLWSEGLFVSGLPWDPCCLSPLLAGWHPPQTWCTGCNSSSFCLLKSDVNCLMTFSSPDRQFPFPILHQVVPLTWTTISQWHFDLLTKHYYGWKRPFFKKTSLLSHGFSCIWWDQRTRTILLECLHSLILGSIFRSPSFPAHALPCASTAVRLSTRRNRPSYITIPR